MTLKDWQLKFEQHNIHLRKRVWRQYSQSLERIIRYLGPDREAGEVFKADIERYRLYRLDRVAASTVRYELAVGRAFYAFIAREGGVEMWFNPFKGVRTLTAP